jgi:putative membrane protein
MVLLIASYLLEGVTIKNFWNALLTALFLAVLNTILKPILIFFSFPLTLITFGLFIFVIDALMLLLVDWLLPGLKIKSFLWALVLAIFLSIVNGILYLFV